MATATLTKYVCADCGETKELSRLPRRWKRLHDDVYCHRCWSDRFILRAITVPVAGPVDLTWEELRPTLRETFSQMTQLSNWACREMLKADVVRLPHMEKLPPMEIPYLYQEARAAFPGIHTGVLSSALTAVQRKYMAFRYEVIWTCSRSAPSFRYPQPYPVRAADWSLSTDENNSLIVSIPLAGRRIRLRLRGGADFRRQRLALLKLLEGKAVKSELALYERKANASDHRPGGKSRDSGGSRARTRLMCKICLWLPKEGRNRGRSGTMTARTDKESLLVAFDSKAERIWICNFDHIRRWVAEHRRKLQRLSEDQKAEQRPVATFQSRREAICRKFNRRMDSACHMAAAQLVNFADRRGYAEIKLDCRDAGFCQSFPYHKLEQLIIDKANAKGINVVIEGG